MIKFDDARLPKRFWNKVRTNGTTGCWEWNGARIGSGYGNIRISGRSVLTHRVAYEALIGVIPEGLQLDHLCRVRSCCNPVHLEPVTPQINALRGEGVAGKHARQTHCMRGHSMVANPKRTGWRICLVCKQMRRDEWRAKNPYRKPPPINGMGMVHADTLALVSNEWQSTTAIFDRVQDVERSTLNQRLTWLKKKGHVESKRLDQWGLEWRLAA